MFLDRRPHSIDPLPPGYRELLGRLLDVAAADERVRAVWLGGSAARGAADAGSDLDVILAVADEAFGEFAAGWRGWLGRVTPTVLARQLPGMPGSWYSLTPGCERLDVVTERASAYPGRASRNGELVLDKDGSFGRPAGQPGTPGTAAGPDPARLVAIVEEFLRQQAIFPAAVVARSDWLLGVQGVQGVHLMLYELFVESNQPLPPMGVKQWSAKLTPAQRECCAELQPPRAERQSVIDAMAAAAGAFRGQARQILAEHGAPWPGELDDAVLAYLSGK